MTYAFIEPRSRGWNAATVGKSADSVQPQTYIEPSEADATAVNASDRLPPHSPLYETAGRAIAADAKQQRTINVWHRCMRICA
jgi:hypothetical protein